MVNKHLRSIFLALLLIITVTFTNTFTGQAIASEPNPSSSETWHRIELPTKATLLDIAFSSTNQDSGWLVGTEGVLLETTDGGKTWEPRNLELGDGIYRFVSVSFVGDEGWIAGKPSLLLHTEDAGKSWNRIGLSSKLPGDPALIKAIAPHTAEMSTDVGAIYRTIDNGQNWKALVTQAVGTVRNLYRAIDGRYIAVSAKGNFYSTWSPGDAAWTQHNRNSSRRVQKMGYTPDGRIWMLNRGGQLQFSTADTVDSWEKPQYPKAAKGIGFLDLAYQDDKNVWVTGGNSILLHSQDGGKSWVKEESISSSGANFYTVLFVGGDRGYILGQNGSLLAYSAQP